MGLAASQARFLAITSRKMNCEFRSMQIAQEKLDVTRDLQTAAQDYQNSLTATKLVWDADGTCDGSGDIYNLSYDVMMTPSALNNYTPYLITDTSGKIVLTESMYSAAVKAGIIDEKTGDPTGKNAFSEGATNATDDGSRNAFLYQLGVSNQIDASTSSAIKNLGSDGYSKSGVGGEIYDKSSANALNTTAFINYLSFTYGDVYSATEIPTGVKSTDAIYNMSFIDALNNAGLTYTAVEATNKLADGKYVITNDGNALSQTDLASVTLGDILTGKYELSAKNCDMQQIAKAILTQMATLLGNGSQEVKGLNVDDESDAALSSALALTLDQYNSNYATSKSSSNVYDLYTLARKQNNVVTGKDNKASFSITNMLKSYLTEFAIMMDGFDSGFGIEKDSAKDSTYITDDLNYTFILKKDAAMTDQTMLNADFYNMFYNQLCQNGASSDTTKQQMVTDSDYLSQALKNGQLFISSLNTDGYFYGGAYTLNGYVAEVTDDDAIARAEAEYEVTKSKLNYKEETLELEMKNLDTEISALTTEFDTVKSLISKNIEKVFTLFSS